MFAVLCWFVLISSCLLFVFVPSLLIITSSFLCPSFATFLYLCSSFSLEHSFPLSVHIPSLPLPLFLSLFLLHSSSFYDFPVIYVDVLLSLLLSYYHLPSLSVLLFYTHVSCFVVLITKLTKITAIKNNKPKFTN